MIPHRLRLILILVAAIAVLIAYTVIDSTGGDSGFLGGMLAVLFPALVDAGAEQSRRATTLPDVPVNVVDSENTRPTRLEK